MLLFKSTIPNVLSVPRGHHQYEARSSIGNGACAMSLCDKLKAPPSTKKRRSFNVRRFLVRMRDA